MTVIEGVYVAAGIALPAYYLPQVLRCASDDTLLASYSMSKAATQWALRAAMLPFVFGVGNSTMTWVVSLDFLGRTVELAAAVRSLWSQGLAAREVMARCIPARKVIARLRLRRTGSQGSPSSASAQSAPPPLPSGVGFGAPSVIVVPGPSAAMTCHMSSTWHPLAQSLDDAPDHLAPENGPSSIKANRPSSFEGNDSEDAHQLNPASEAGSGDIRDVASRVRRRRRRRGN